MTGDSSAQIKLCPQCANSIAEDATECRYCKADLSSKFAPQWLKRSESSQGPRISSGNQKKFAVPGNVTWIGALLGVALVAFFAGASTQRNQQSSSSDAHLKQLQAKDQVIQAQEAQLAQTRQQLNENSQQLAEVKAKLEASQKELALSQQRLSAARPADRSSANRSPVAAGTVSRTADRSASAPPPAPSNRTAATRPYETTRATSVYEGPSATARVISQIPGGIRINVASVSGGWLEVRSRHGNPPGYVRADDARPIGATN